MKLFLLIALLGLVASDDYYDEGYYRNYTERHRYWTPAPTAEPRAFMQRVLDIRHGDVNETVVENDVPVDGRQYRWNDDVSDFVYERVIPELCYLTSKNWTVYNSYILDRNSLREFESMSPECRSFRCDAVHYFLKHGADVWMNFMQAGSIKEAVQVADRELTAIFDEMNVCTCGKEFIGALFRSAPFYEANVARGYSCYNNIQHYARNLDIRSISRIFDILIDGICVETSGGRCLNSIFTSLEEVAQMVQKSLEEGDDYEEGDRKFKKQQEKRCDVFYGPMNAFQENENYGAWRDGWAVELEATFNKTAAFANDFYCNKHCKKVRSSVYPCCMRIMLENKKLHNLLRKFLVSVYRYYPTSYLHFDGYGEIDEYFLREYSVEDIMSWTIPESLWDAGMRTLNAAKYCEGKMVKCSDNPRPEP